jgi:dihydroxy-acid dehydratase
MANNLLPYPDAITANGKTMGENCATASIENSDVILSVSSPMKPDAGFVNLSGNLFDSAIMKTSAISKDFRARYLSDPKSLNAFEGRAVVFDGPEEFHAKIDDPALNIDANCILFMRGAGPVGYPGGAEVVNMRPPNYLLKQGIEALPCVGDGRQSGTSGSPSILNASPEAATGGGLALVQSGDMVRIDLNEFTANIMISDEELSARKEAFDAKGGYPSPESQSPWQEYFRDMVEPFSEGMVLRGATKYKSIAKKNVPRDNH